MVAYELACVLKLGPTRGTGVLAPLMSFTPLLSASVYRGAADMSQLLSPTTSASSTSKARRKTLICASACERSESAVTTASNSMKRPSR